MKRIVLLISLVLSCIFALAQDKTTQITLRNGTVLSGEMKEMDPLSHVLMSIGGVDVKIEMRNIESIQSIKTSTSTMTANINDSKELPDSIVFQVGEERLVMILIKGGDFQMGYDGRGSMRMNSEPVHPVRLSSFYVSQRPLSNAIVSGLIEGKVIGSKNNSFNTPKRVKAIDIISRLNLLINKSFRLPTEAEWEFIATTTNKHRLYYWIFEREFCFDRFCSYPNNKDPLINPQGPSYGLAFVTREWSDIYYRHGDDEGYRQTSIRVVLPISEVR